MENQPQINQLDALILRNTVGDELNLMRTQPAELEQGKYREVLADGTLGVAGAFASANLTQTVAMTTDIGQQLFTNAMDPTALMHFNNGGVGTAVKSVGGKIIGHSGFTPVNGITVAGTVSNPAIPLIMMTTMVVKEQFQEINEKLDVITDKLNAVVDIMHAEKMGQLLTIDERIKAITKQTNISDANLNELATMANDAQNVYHQYKILLDQSDVTDLLKVKGFNDQGRVKAMMQKVAASDYMQFFKVAYYADSLSWLVRLTIIASMVKRGEDSAVIEERVNAFKEQYELSFVNNAKTYVEKVRTPIVEKALTMVTKMDSLGDVTDGAFNKLTEVAGHLPFKAAKKVRSHAENYQKSTEDEKEKLTLDLDNQFDALTQPVFGQEVGTIADNVIQQLTTPQEIVYAMEDGSDEVRIFVRDEKIEVVDGRIDRLKSN